MVAVVFLKPRIADGDAGLGFEAPVARENPGITVFPAKGKEVTLKAAVLDGFVKSEGNLGITHVEMAVDGIQKFPRGICLPAYLICGQNNDGHSGQ